MDSDTWNAYHIVSNRARSVCYATRQQHFRRRAELTVNALISTATSQLHAMEDLKVCYLSALLCRYCYHCSAGLRRNLIYPPNFISLMCSASHELCSIHHFYWCIRVPSGLRRNVSKLYVLL